MKRPRFWSKVIPYAIVVAIPVLAVLGYGKFRYGSLSGSVAALRGQVLYVEAPIRYLGSLAPGKTYTVRFRMRNVSSGKVRILGSQTSCACTVPEELPLLISPGEERDFQVVVTPPESQDSFGQEVKLFINNPNQPLSVLVMTGDIDPTKMPAPPASHQ